ncbi:hypothetical protein GCK32_018474 [Trichostrongylus colubriformis]|uniref:Uncharacterized protein n=1 Tax=Trichostrongylus colubriformis TaxID=6319 RepID=A0AAN8IP62_TRICO
MLLLVFVRAVFTMPAYVDSDDISEIERSLPAVNLDLLRYLSDNLNNVVTSRDSTTSTTSDPRGLNFAQFVVTDKCSGPAAWSCFTDIDTNRE